MQKLVKNHRLNSKVAKKKNGDYPTDLFLMFVYLQRGKDVPKILIFSEDGYLLQKWNTSTEMPHGIFAAKTSNASSVWITDVGMGMQNNYVRSINKDQISVSRMGS